MPIICYFTTKDKEEAKKIIMELLQQKLIACANIFPIESLYEWENALCEETEYAIIAKTVQENFTKIENTVKHLHSYEIPCIVAYPLCNGNQDFLSWITTTVKN